MATAGQVTATTTAQEIDLTKVCSTLLVAVPAASDQDVQINVPGLHATDEYFIVTKGTSQSFSLYPRGLAKFNVVTGSSTGTVNYCIQSIQSSM